LRKPRKKSVRLKRDDISRSASGPGSAFARGDRHKRLESSHIICGGSILLLLMLVVMLVFGIGRGRVETSRGVVTRLKGVGVMRWWRWRLLWRLLLIDRLYFVVMIRRAVCRRSSRLRVVIRLEARVSPDRLDRFVRRVRYLVLLLLLQLLMLMLSVLLWQNASWRIDFLRAVGMDNHRVIFGPL